MRIPLKKAIQRWFWPLMPGWPDEGRRIVQGPHVKALLERASSESRSFRAVFNAGAGEGGYSRLLLALPGVESVVESDFDWRSKGIRRIDPRQVFFCASLVSIPLVSHQFDLVFCTEVLEHIREHEDALDEIARVMNAGGWLLITVPTPPAVPDSAHVREGYRREELASMLTERGFKVVASRSCMYWSFRYLLKIWPRCRPWCPRILILSLAYLDRLLLIGPPMDLMILAQMTDHGNTPIRSAAEPKMEQEGAEHRS
jgi:SAM-dependent methyltransferase